MSWAEVAFSKGMVLANEELDGATKDLALKGLVAFTGAAPALERRGEGAVKAFVARLAAGEPGPPIHRAPTGLDAITSELADANAKDEAALQAEEDWREIIRVVEQIGYAAAQVGLTMLVAAI